MRAMANKLLFLFLTLAMLLGMTTMVMAKDTKLAKKLASQLTVYYENYQEAAETDIERVLGEIKLADEGYGAAWEKIMNYWRQANADGFTNVGTVPQGLPQDDSLCIVILGYALNKDGTMHEELIGRLETGLAIAMAYPNAYVCVTGGSSVPNFTEGDLMGKWLVQHGLEESRLIVENASRNTVENASFTYKILNTQYKQVNQIVLVTSEYHVPRGSILYYTKFVLGAYSSGGSEIEIVSNAGFHTGKGSESFALQAQGMRSIAGLEETEVTLSLLDSLTVTQASPYVAGNDLTVTVEAKYDSDYSRIVNATVTGFDKTQDASQTVTISYTENDVTVSGEVCLTETTAEIIGSQVATKAALFAKLQKPGTVYVKLGTDIELTYSACKIPEGTTAILDLNGHTITSANSSAAYLQNDGNLVIRDSSAKKSGGIAVTSTSSDVKCIRNAGSLTIEGGTFTATSEKGNAHIVCSTAGSVCVSGGIFQIDGAVFDGTSATITGGTFLDASGNNTHDVTAYLTEEYTQLEEGSVVQMQEFQQDSQQDSQNENVVWIILPLVLALSLLTVALLKAKAKKK